MAACVLLAIARGRRLLAHGAVALAVAGPLVAPAAWARTTQLAAVAGVSPGAGPAAGLVSGTPTARGPGSFGGGFAPPGGGNGGAPAGGAPGGGIVGSTQGVDAALAYATAHGATARFPLIVQSQQGVASAVIAGSRVAALGGFSGRESAMSAAAIARVVATGDARYVLLADVQVLGAGDTRGTSPATTAIASVCTAVGTSGAWSGTLYDCVGKAAQLQAAG